MSLSYPPCPAASCRMFRSHRGKAMAEYTRLRGRLYDYATGDTAIRSSQSALPGDREPYAWRMLIRVDYSAYMMTDAIGTAVLNGAQVINISASGGCSVWDWDLQSPARRHLCDVREGRFVRGQ